MQLHLIAEYRKKETSIYPYVVPVQEKRIAASLFIFTSTTLLVGNPCRACTEYLLGPPPLRVFAVPVQVKWSAGQRRKLWD
jgi:hypothetical protein